MTGNVRQAQEVSAGEFASFVRCIEALPIRQPTSFVLSEVELAEVDRLNETLPMKECVRLVLLARREP